MSSSSDMVNLKRLIDIGKDKGYITYEELNDDLSDEITSSEYIDDLMMMFEELDIMVIDEAAKEKIEKTQKLKKKEEKAPEKTPFRAEPSESGSKVSDPVKMYLKEMGCISLLTREGEVEIAKRIEAGELEALNAFLKCRIGIEYIINLGAKLKRGEVKIKDVINDLDDEESQAQTGEKRESIIQLIDEIRVHYEECCELKKEAQKRKCPAAKRKKLSAKAEKNHKRIVDLINSFKLEKRQLDRMVERLRETVAAIEDSEKDIAECMVMAGGKPVSFLNKCLRQIPKTAKDDQKVTPLKLRKDELLEMKTKLESSKKNAR